MAKPKDPAVPPVTEPPTPPATDALDGASLQQLIEVIATATAQMQGLKGHELKDQVRSLVAETQHVVRDVEQKVAVDETKKQTVAEVQRLIDVLMQASLGAAKVIGPHRDAIAQMFRHVDFEKMSAGLSLISDYLQNPTDVTEAKIKTLMGELEKTMGPIVGYDPAREEEQRREELHKDVQARLDKIFRKPKPETKE